MKVAFVEQESRLGGVEYTTLRTAQAMQQDGYDVVLLCPQEGDLPCLAQQSGLRVEIVPRPAFPSVSLFWGKRYIANPFGFLLTAVNVLRAMLSLRRYLHKNAPHVIITKGLLAHFYGGWAARTLGIPCLWYIQEEVDGRRGGGFYRFILNWGAQKNPDRIAVDAAALLAQFSNSPALQNKIRIIHNGIDTRQFAQFSLQDKQCAKENFGISPNVIVIGQVGRLIPLKGQVVLLQAFAQLTKDFPNIHLLFVGAPLFGSQDYEQELRSQTAQLGLTERTHFAGFIPDVRQGLAAIDIFVHASIETDSPVSVLEAMSCGLPVVVSGVRGTVEMIDPGVNALIFEPGNSNALASALDKLLKSPQLQKELGKQARATIIEKFSLQTSVNRLESLIKEVYAA